MNFVLRSVVWAGAIVCWLSLRGRPGTHWSDVSLTGSTILGLALTFSGLAVFAWAGRALAGAVPSALDAPAVLLIRGPFRFVRNPLYLAAAAIFVGTTTIYGLWEPRDVFVVGAVAVLMHVFVVYREEPATRRRFGPAYDAYCKRVPRWIPRISI